LQHTNNVRIIAVYKTTHNMNYKTIYDACADLMHGDHNEDEAQTVIINGQQFTAKFYRNGTYRTI
jgi:hypothetical protein